MANKIYYKYQDNYPKQDTATITIYKNNKIIYTKTDALINMVDILTILNGLEIKQI